MIKVQKVSREFKYHTKESGLRASVKNLFHRNVVIKQAVQNISFEIGTGEIVGFLGPNGAGKTTTLKMLSGILCPTSGVIEVDGFVPFDKEILFKKRLAVILGNKSQLWPDLPPIDSFEINKAIYEIPDPVYKKRLTELSEMLNVSALLNIQVRRLSLGERMKMEIIASLLHNPSIVLLDEPTIGLDLLSQKNVREFIRQYNQEYKATILITSHYMDDIEALCKRIIIINKGTVVYDGDIKNVNGGVEKYKIVQLNCYSALDLTGLNGIEGVISSEQKEGFAYSITVIKEKLTSVLSSLFGLTEIADINITEPPLEIQLEQLFS